ncbi:lipopolysaccharide biosynthesis protein [Micromonospora sp. WMMD754]|uniref:lipopolysaccharide biosynthesis protein n=1 Tax=unclassified Micromonospora TaxID=2617518 RepID=UPI0012FD6070|nr:lipopolysaccharide biosynthesis protein [Micromonospora sp. WMMA2032]
MSVLALTGMVTFADLGLGAGLMTKLAPCYSNGDAAQARSYISTAYALLSSVAVGLCGLLWLGSGLVPWTAVFNVTGAVGSRETTAVVMICLTAFLLNIPLALIVRVQYAYQQVASCAIWQAAGTLATVPVVLLAARGPYAPLAVVTATALGPLLTNLAVSIWIFRRRMPELRPRLAAIDRRLSTVLIRLSGGFFVVFVLYAVSYNADNLIIAHALGPQSVTAYALPAKMVSLVGMLVSMINVPLWPANGDALARGDLTWVHQTVRRMVTLALLATAVPTAVLALVGDWIFSVWLPMPLGGGSRWLLAGLGLYFVLVGMFSVMAMVQNAAGVVRPQLVGQILFLGTSVPAKWFAATRYGLNAVPFVGCAAYALTVGPAVWYGYRRTIRRYRGAAAEAADSGGVAVTATSPVPRTTS